MMHGKLWLSFSLSSMVVVALCAACERSEPASEDPLTEAQREQLNQARAEVATRGSNARADFGSPGATTPSQPAGTRPRAQGSAAGAVDKPNEEQMEQFAEAYVEVQKVNQRYAPQLKEAPDAEHAREIQQKATKATMNALAEVGLSPSDYSGIAETVQRDPALYQAFMKQLKEQ